MNNKNAITELIKDIQREADQYCKSITEETDSYVKRETEKAYKKAHTDIKTFKKNEIDRLNEETNSVYSELESEEKRSLLELRRNLSDKLFQNAEKKISAFTESESYCGFLTDNVDEVLTAIGEDCEIILCPRDRKYEEILLKKCRFVSYSDSIKFGGCKGINKSAALAADNTIDSRLIQEKEKFFCKKELSLTLKEQGDDIDEQLN